MNKEVILCSGDWRKIVIDSFEVSREGSYPGVAFFEEEALQRCDPYTSNFIFPAEDNWEAGRRLVYCLVLPESIFTPGVGDCFDVTVEDRLTVGSEVPCDEPHTLEAFAVLRHAAETFPGSVAMDEFADQACGQQFEAYERFPHEESEIVAIALRPTRGTWDLTGQRSVHCYLFIPTVAGEFETLTSSFEGAGK